MLIEHLNICIFSGLITSWNQSYLHNGVQGFAYPISPLVQAIWVPITNPNWQRPNLDITSVTNCRSDSAVSTSLWNSLVDFHQSVWFDICESCGYLMSIGKVTHLLFPMGLHSTGFGKKKFAAEQHSKRSIFGYCWLPNGILLWEIKILKLWKMWIHFIIIFQHSVIISLILYENEFNYW